MEQGLEQKLNNIPSLRGRGDSDKEIAKRMGVREEEIVAYDKKMAELLRNEEGALRHVAFKNHLDFFHLNLYLSYTEVFPQRIGIERDNIDMNIPITQVGFSTRVVNSLTNNGITTLRGLVQQSEPDLMSLRSFGRKCLEEVKSFLREESSFSTSGCNGKTRQKVSEIKRLINEGVKNVPGIAEKTGSSYGNVSYLGRKYGIKFEDKRKEARGARRNPDIDFLIDNPELNMEDIGENVDLTPQGISAYLKRTKQKEKYQKVRADYRQNLEEEEYQDILRKEFLGQIALQIVWKSYKNASWAEKKTFESLESVKGSVNMREYFSFDTLSEFFQRYRNAEDNGEKLSLEELTGGLKLGIQTAEKFLRELV